MTVRYYSKWEPVSNLESILYLEGLHDDYEGFRMLLKGGSQESCILRITFEAALTYRNIDEGDYLESFEGAEGLINWSLYTLKESDFISWFLKESCGIHDEKDIVQYSIHTPNDCIEVLSKYPPLVEWLNT